MTSTTMQLQKKKRSKILNKLLTELNPNFEKLQPKVDAVYKQARKEGFSDMEIGEFVRSQMKEHYSDRTIQRVLPDTAKHTEFANKADKLSASEHEKALIELPDDKVKITKSLTNVEPKYTEGIDNDSYTPESPNPTIPDSCKVENQQSAATQEYEEVVAKAKQKIDPVKFEQDQQTKESPAPETSDLDSEFKDYSRDSLIGMIKGYRRAIESNNQKFRKLQKQIAEVQPFIDYLQRQTPEARLKTIDHYKLMNDARGKSTSDQTENSEKSKSEHPDKEAAPVKKKSKSSKHLAPNDQVTAAGNGN